MSLGSASIPSRKLLGSAASLLTMPPCVFSSGCPGNSDRLSCWLAIRSGYSCMLSGRLEASPPAGVLSGFAARRAAIFLHAVPFCLSQVCAWLCDPEIQVELEIRPCCWLLNSSKTASVCYWIIGWLHICLALDQSGWAAVLSTVYLLLTSV